MHYSLNTLLSGLILSLIDFLFLWRSRCGVWSPAGSGSPSSRTLWRPARPPTTMTRRNHDSWRERTGSCRRSSRRWGRYINNLTYAYISLTCTNARLACIVNYPGGRHMGNIFSSLSYALIIMDVWMTWVLHNIKKENYDTTHWQTDWGMGL